MNHDIDHITGLVGRPPPAAHPFGPPSVAAILDVTVLADPERLALIDGDRRWSYAQLDAAVGLAAGALTASGVGCGDRVVWSLPNSAELIVGFVATQRLGAVWVGLHPRLTPSESAVLLADCRPKLIIDDLTTWRDASAEANDFVAAEIDAHAPAAFAYTSGTTSTPKAAVHSQHNLLWPGLISIEMEPPGPDDRTGTPFALTTLNLMVLGPLTAFARGGTAVVLGRTDAAGFAADVASTRLTRAVVVPTMLHDLLAEDVEPSLLSSLRTMLVGGAGTPPRTRDGFRHTFGIVPVLSYGLSEAPTGVARTGGDPSLGASPLAPIEILILNDDGEAVEAGVDGEICLRPASSGSWAGSWSPTLGYWRRPAETLALFRHGVLHTDDIGAIDADGRLLVRGRAGDVIVRGGANVYPNEIERVLLDYVNVATAAAVGLPDQRLGQCVVAVVTAMEGPIDVEGLRGHCRERLAPYKVPETITVLDEIPTNRAGKIRRSVLPALLSEAAGAPEPPSL